MAYTVFISDMHLSAETPQLNQLFHQQMLLWGKEADAVYLLGDIFDVWFGDDQSPVIRGIMQDMANFSQQKPLYILHGNRDFLLGKRFMRQTGAKLLSSPAIVDLYGKSYILTHGDELCTEDKNYQTFRRYRGILRFLMWIIPLNIRRKIATSVRKRSEQRKHARGYDHLSDVTENGLHSIQHNPPLDMIHGHTHRPATHQHTFQGQTYQRFVLPDWKEAQGGSLKIFDNGKIERDLFS